MMSFVRSLSLAALAAGLLSAGPARAQTLDDVAFTVDCTLVEADSAFLREGGCTPGEALYDWLTEGAQTAVELWSVIAGPDAPVGLVLDASGRAALSVIPEETLRGEAYSALQAPASRTAGPVFYDASEGRIWVYSNVITTLRDSSYFSEGAGWQDFDRAVGLAVAAARSDAAREAIARGDEDVLMLLEGLANINAALSLPRNAFSASVREHGENFVLNPDGDWDYASLYMHLYSETRALTGQSSEAVFRALHEGVTGPGDQYGFIRNDLDRSLRALGAEGGAHRLLGRAMARLQTDEARFVSERERFFLNEAASGAQEVYQGQLNPYAAVFLDVHLLGLGSRETVLDITLSGDVDGDPVRELTLMVGDASLAPSNPDAQMGWMEQGISWERLGDNAVRLVIPPSADRLSQADSFGLPIGVFLASDRVSRYELSFESSARQAACDWSDLMASVNPYWLGVPGGRDSLLPPSSSVDADVRPYLAQIEAQMAADFGQMWYRTEDEFIRETDWSFSIPGSVAYEQLGEDAWRVTRVSGPIYAELAMDDDTLAASEALFQLMMPVAARARLSGAVSDGGRVCVSPLARSGMAGMSGLSAMDANDPAAMLAAMGLPPELLTTQDPNEALNMILTARGAFDPYSESQESPAGDLVFQVFSPQAWTLQQGMIGSGAMLPVSHTGHGGWRPNSALSLYVTLPGVSASDLRVGSFPARADTGLTAQMIGFDADVDADPASGLPFYLWGAREGEEIRFEDYVAPDLSGTLTVHRISGGVVTASLRLQGQTWLRSSEDAEREDPDPQARGPVELVLENFQMLAAFDGEALLVTNPLDLVTVRVTGGQD